MNITRIAQTDNTYPPLLREIHNPPESLYAAGVFPPAHMPCIGIVGTRMATPYGISVAETFAFELARAGIVIVSGLAIGIDAAAHRGALRAKGKTLAILPAHPTTIYPRRHQTLAASILSGGGCVLSEYQQDTPIASANFIARNRIISGLAHAIIIIEAPLPSGALSTARFALEQNRDIFVVPGPITSKTFLGSHLLISQGATLVSSSKDVLRDLRLDPDSTVGVDGIGE